LRQNEKRNDEINKMRRDDTRLDRDEKINETRRDESRLNENRRVKRRDVTRRD